MRNRRLAEFASAEANAFGSVFAGGVYVGENTARSANVRAKRVRCSAPQLFQFEAASLGFKLI